MAEKERKPVSWDIDGGGPSWWYVCVECHGTIDYKAKECPHCKHPIIWEDVVPKKVKK